MPRENSPNFLAKLSSEVISVSYSTILFALLSVICMLNQTVCNILLDRAQIEGTTEVWGKLSVLPPGSQPRWYHHPVQSQASVKSSVRQSTETNLMKKKKAPIFRKEKNRFNILGRAFIVLQRNRMVIIQIFTFTYYLS